MKLGSVELQECFGGYEFVNTSVNNLPQDVATAISTVNSGLLGATYDPILYVGKQIVNGTNHMFIAKEIRVTKDQDKTIVALVINIPAGDFSGEKAKIVDIIESVELPTEVNKAYERTVGWLLGVNYKPLAYLGSQVVKGTNHYILCSATPVCQKNPEPRLMMIAINVFQDEYSIVSIEPVTEEKEEPVTLSAPLGEWP